MPTLFLLFNHQFTPAQHQAARAELDVQEVVPLPPHLQDLWGQIPPDRMTNLVVSGQTWRSLDRPGGLSYWVGGRPGGLRTDLEAYGQTWRPTDRPGGLSYWG